MAPVTLRPWRIPQVLILKLRGLVRIIHTSLSLGIFFLGRGLFCLHLHHTLTQCQCSRYECKKYLKGQFTQKLTHPHLVPNLYKFQHRRNIKVDNLENVGIQTTLDPVDWMWGNHIFQNVSQKSQKFGTTWIFCQWTIPLSVQGSGVKKFWGFFVNFLPMLKQLNVVTKYFFY